MGFSALFFLTGDIETVLIFFKGYADGYGALVGDIIEVFSLARGFKNPF